LSTKGRQVSGVPNVPAEAKYRSKAWLRMASMSCPACPPRATPFDKNLDICDSSSVFVTRRFVSTKAPRWPACANVCGLPLAVIQICGCFCTGGG
jgi:hypothetical protein